MTAYKKISDEILFDLMREGDHHAYVELYNRFFGVLYIHAFKKLKDKGDAQDVIQDIFARLWHRRNEITIETKVSYYLYTCVRNRILDQIEHSKVKDKYVASLQDFIDAGANTTDEYVDTKELSSAIEREIASLHPQMRKVFVMSRFQGMKYKEIASELNISEQTVRTHVKKALRILRTRLGVVLYVQLLLHFLK